MSVVINSIENLDKNHERMQNNMIKKGAKLNDYTKNQIIQLNE